MKEYMKNYMREYNKNNKIEIYKRLYSFKKCEICGCEYKSNNKTHHLKSKNHIVGELQLKVKELKNLINEKI